jgi:TolA-binding protein
VRLTSLTIGSLSILALLFVGGCADQSGMDQLNQNEFALRGMIASDRQRIDSLQAQIKRQQDEIAELKHGAPAAAGAPSSDVNDRIARLESEVGAMQAALPTVPPAPPVGSAPGSSAPAIPGAPAASAPGAPPAPAASAANAVTWPQDLDREMASAQGSREPGAKLYRDGLKAMKDGNYPSAVVKFAALQHRYPKSSLSEPAEYFSANALYESGKFDQSILQFNDLVMRFPRGRFSCQSMLRQGQAFMKLNDKIDARLILQKLGADGNCSAEQPAANGMLKELASD